MSETGEAQVEARLAEIRLRWSRGIADNPDFDVARDDFAFLLALLSDQRAEQAAREKSWRESMQLWADETYDEGLARRIRDFLDRNPPPAPDPPQKEDGDG
jgi:hypothetical protein